MSYVYIYRKREREIERERERNTCVHTCTRHVCVCIYIQDKKREWEWDRVLTDKEHEARESVPLRTHPHTIQLVLGECSVTRQRRCVRGRGQGREGMRKCISLVSIACHSISRDMSHSTPAAIKRSPTCQRPAAPSPHSRTAQNNPPKKITPPKITLVSFLVRTVTKYYKCD